MSDTNSSFTSSPVSFDQARTILADVSAYNAFAASRFFAEPNFWVGIRAGGGLRGRPPAPWLPRLLKLVEQYEADASGMTHPDGAESRFERALFIGGALVHSLAAGQRVSVTEVCALLKQQWLMDTAEAEFMSDLLAADRALAKGSTPETSKAPTPKAPKPTIISATPARSAAALGVPVTEEVPAAEAPVSVADLTAQLVRGVSVETGEDLPEDLARIIAESTATFVGQPMTSALLVRMVSSMRSSVRSHLGDVRFEVTVGEPELVPETTTEATPIPEASSSVAPEAEVDPEPDMAIDPLSLLLD